MGEDRHESEHLTEQLPPDDREAISAAEALLRASEFDAAFDATANGVLIYDTEGLLVRANRTAIDVFGVVPGRTHWREQLAMLRLCHPDGRPFTAPDLPIARALRGETVCNAPLSLTTPTGERRSVFATATPVYVDGRLTGALVIWNDVTESEQAHEALRQSDERLRVALNGTTVSVWNQDRDLRYTWVYNPQVFGEEQMLGKTDLELHEATDAARRLTEWKRRVLNSGASDRLLFDFRHGDVQMYWEITAEPLLDAAGEVAGLTGATVDVTEHKRMQEALRAGRDALEQRVQERTAELLDQIVGRMQLEESLQKSEERFRAAVEMMLDLVGIYSAIRDAHGRIVDFRIEYVNPALSVLNRYGQDEQIGQTLLTLLPAHRDTGLFEAYCRVVETGEPLVLDSFVYEEAPHGKDPISLVLDLRVTRLGDGLFVTGRDVTARVQAEAALREREAQLRASEVRYRSVVEDQTEMIARFRADGEILFVNSAWNRFFGGPAEHVVGRSAWPVVAEEDRERVAERLQSMTLDHPIAVIDNRVLVAGGEVRWTQWVNRGFFDAEGRLVEWQAVGRDTTERTLMEEALRQSTQTIRRQAERDQALAELGRAVAEAGFDFRAVAETATTRVVDLLADAATVQLVSADGQTLTPISFYHRDPEAVALFNRLLQTPLQIGQGLGGQVVATGTSLRLSMPSNEMRALVQPEHVEYLERVGLSSVVLVPLRVQGNVIGALMASRDHPGHPFTAEDEAFLQQVADRVALAVQSARLFQDAQWALAEREEAEADVRRLNAGLEERVRERTAELESFAYSVSHDLRSPLRAINGYSRMLIDDVSAGLDAESRRKLDVICLNALKMSELIDGILALSRLGRAELRPAPVDMAALARDVFAELQLASPQDEIELDLRPLPEAYGDGALLRQVWINLLSNAVKYSRPKGEIHIEVGGRAEGREIEYYVKDRGVGFDMRYSDKLFGVFQRLHSDAEFEGTGVGLALVERIVQRHGGRVRVEAQVGEGATFYFSLPRRGNNRAS